MATKWTAISPQMASRVRLAMLGPGTESQSAKKKRLSKLSSETAKNTWAARIHIGKQAKRWVAIRHQRQFVSDEAFAEAVLDT
jgi:hypothetical protein